jgi:hypothetical protein
MLVTDLSILRKQEPYKLDLAAETLIEIARTTPSPSYFEACAQGYRALIQAGAKPRRDGDVLFLNPQTHERIKQDKEALAFTRVMVRDYLSGMRIRTFEAKYNPQAAA